MAGTYKNFLRLLEKWPIDASKKKRDIGIHIREQIKLSFTAGELNPTVDQEQCDRRFMSLKRLADDHHKNLYHRSSSSSATGLTAEQCNAILSDEFLDHLAEQKNSIFVQVKYSIDSASKQDVILHKPVMKEQVLDNIGLNNDSVVLDMTFGAGGHTKSILERFPGVKVYCLDRDPVAYNLANELAKEYPEHVVPLLGRFSELPDLMKANGLRQNCFDAILFDFGCSSMQFDVGERGFSLSKDGPLDMRMDGARFPDNPTAADVLATADEHDLYKIFKVYGEEKQAKKIARAVVEARYMFTPLQTTRELADLIASVLFNETRTDKLDRHAHVATKVFQALRIFVNNEINEINYGMLLAQRFVKIHGRLVAICFHSLEDLIVKRHLTGNMTDDSINVLPLEFVDNTRWHDKQSMKEYTSSNWKPIHKHVLLPSSYEVEANPRSRSAKLRAAIRIS